MANMTFHWVNHENVSDFDKAFLFFKPTMNKDGNTNNHHPVGGNNFRALHAIILNKNYALGEVTDPQENSAEEMSTCIILAVINYRFLNTFEADLSTLFKYFQLSYIIIKLTGNEAYRLKISESGFIKKRVLKDFDESTYVSKIPSFDQIEQHNWLGRWAIDAACKQAYGKMAK